MLLKSKKALHNAKIDKLIDAQMEVLLKLDPVEDHRQCEIVEQTIVRYTALKQKSTIDPDTLIVVGANLCGILLIINHERIGVISTKALGFVGKGRV